jgi:hypothetical protein
MAFYLLTPIHDSEDDKPLGFVDLTGMKLKTKEELYNEFLKENQKMFREYKYGENYGPKSIFDIYTDCDYNFEIPSGASEEKRKSFDHLDERFISTSTKDNITINYYPNTYRYGNKKPICSGPFEIVALLQYGTSGGLRIGFYSFLLRKNEEDN